MIIYIMLNDIEAREVPHSQNRSKISANPAMIATQIKTIWN